MNSQPRFLLLFAHYFFSGKVDFAVILLAGLAFSSLPPFRLSQNVYLASPVITS